MDRATPAITIRIRPADSDKAFVFQYGDSQPVAVGSKSTFEQAMFEQSTLRDKLEEIKKIGAGRLKLLPEEADEAFQKLYEVGQLVMISLLGDDLGDPAADLGELVGTAMAAARLCGETPWVHITSADNDPIAYAVPFELVPFLMSDPPRSIARDPTRLAEVLDGFLGFSAVVSRDRGNLFNGGMIAHQDNRLPVKLFQNVTLPNSEAEMAYFAGQERFDVDGPWPLADVTEESFANILLKQIFDPTRRIDGSERPLADQIQHFACHCDTFGAPNEHRFILAGDAGRPLAMKLTQLQIKLLELSKKKERSTSEMPLIFLNACGASAVDPRQLGSFVRFFLLNENRGFIGAQTMIPDAFAREYAAMFYTSLLTDAMPVGEAVLNARRKLAERQLNMLGLLYMHYGPAELRLAA